jgi:hypothetical protein
MREARSRQLPSTNCSRAAKRPNRPYSVLIKTRAVVSNCALHRVLEQWQDLKTHWRKFSLNPELFGPAPVDRARVVIHESESNVAAAGSMRCCAHVHPSG